MDISKIGEEVLGAITQKVGINLRTLYRYISRLKEEGLIEINRRNIRLHIEAAV